MAKELKDYVVTIPDFPAPGVMFRDVTSVIQDPDGLQLAVDTMQDLVKDVDYDVIIGAESSGFIFGAPIAYNQHKALVLARKQGKLPRETVSETYALEYGTATLEIHKDAIKPGQKVLIVDDLIATGGTMMAGWRLLKRLGAAPVEGVAVMDLPELGGSAHLRAAGLPLHTLLEFDGQ